jgi:hypothetical protein
LLKFLISIPLLERSRKSRAVRLEGSGLIHHLLHFFLDISPCNVFPLGNGILYFGIQVVELVKEINFFLGFLKFWVRLMRKTEEGFTSTVRNVFSFSDLILFRLHLKSVQSFFWLNSRNHRTLLIEVFSEKDNVINEHLDTTDKGLFELGLLTLKFISDSDRLSNKFFPILVDDGGRVFVSFLVNLIIIQVVLKKVVHFDNWSEFDFDSRLLLSDFIKGVHDVTKRINIFSWLLDLEFNVLDFFSKLINVSLSFLKEIFSISIFPENNPFLESSFDVVSLQAQSTDLVMDHDGVNFILTLSEG